MKIFKKFLAALIAVVMALGIFAFAACKDDGKGSGEGEGPGPSGSGITVTTAQFLNVLKSQQVKQLEIVATTSTKMKTDDNGTAVEVEVAKTGYDAKYNLTDKNADVESYTAEYDETKKELVYDYGYSFVRDGYNFYNTTESSDPFDKVEPENYSSLKLIYDGLATLKGVDMFKNLPVVLPNANYAIANLANVAGALTINNGVVTLDYNKVVYSIVQDIKDVVDGLEETTTVGDILANEKVRKYLSVFTELIPNNQVIETGLKALPALLEMFSKLGEDDFEEMFGDMGMYLMMAQGLLTGVSFDELAKVSPEGCATTYDYIVKILGSDALRDIVNAVLANFMGGGDPGDAEQTALTAAEGEEAPAPGDEGPADEEEEPEQGLPNLTNISVGLILGMVNAGKEDSEKLTLAGVKSAFAGLAESVTEEGFYFTMPALGGDDSGTDMQDGESSDSSAPAPMYISGAKIEYTLSSATALSAQALSVKVTSENDGTEYISDYVTSLTYSATKYQLADVSNNAVEYDTEVWNTGTYISYPTRVGRYVSGESPVYYSGNEYSFSLDFVNGEVKDNSLKVYDKDKNVVTPEQDGSYKFEIYREVTPQDGETPAVYNYNDKQTYTLEIEVTGGTIDQAFIDGLESANEKEYYAQYMGKPYVKITRGEESYSMYDNVYSLNSKVGDLLTYLKTQASQPNA